MFILPPHRILNELLPVRRRRRRLRDLGDQIRCRRLRDPVDQDAQEWDLEEDVEAEGEAEEEPLTVVEPEAFLFAGVVDAGEVWFEL